MDNLLRYLLYVALLIENYNFFLHKPFKSWEAFDFESICKFFFFGGIDLGQDNAGSLKILGSDSILWGKFFAMSAIGKNVVSKCGNDT